MLRQNNTCEGIITEYQNHNITLKFHPETITNIELHNNVIEILSFLFDSIDCYLIDEGCAGNDEMYITIYNAYSDKIYLLLENREISQKLEKGYCVRLRALNIDQDTRATINNYFGD